MIICWLVQVVQLEMGELIKIFEPTVSAFEQLGQQYDIMDVEKVQERCDNLEARWKEIETVLPQRVRVVRDEMETWVKFDEKLEEFQSWLQEVEEMCEEWKTQENSINLIQNLEVGQEFLFHIAAT